MWPRFPVLIALLCTSVAGHAEFACQNWFDALDHAVTSAGLTDVGAQRIDDYPHLRKTRWLTFLQDETTTDEQQQQWLQLAKQQARTGWLSELTRLEPLTTQLSPGVDWRQQLDICLDDMTALTGFPGIPKDPVDDAYSTRNRWLGLYPITRILAAPSMNSYRDEMALRFRRPARLPIRHYQVESFPGTPPPPSELSRNPLEIPLPSEGARRALLNFYAPVLSVADPLVYNQPGSILIDAGVPQVDHRQPAAYSWLSWTRYKGHNLLQLNYQFWFSERPPEGGMELYSGPLDSIIWRVTLKPDGNVLMYDSIHGCGCYHKVYPVARGLVAAQDGPKDPVYFPGVAPNATQQRVSLVLEPDTHYIVRVEKFIPGQQLERYQIKEADHLRQLTSAQGHVTSLYNSQGLVPASARRERFILWPLGVPSAGAMRQPGRHAIAFIGKRHFDDAELLEVLFE